MIVLGIDVGGTSVKAGVVEFTDEVVVHDRRQASSRGSETDLDRTLARIVAELSADHPVVGVGVAVAGFVDATKRWVTFAPHLSWRSADVPARLTRSTGLPVVLEHDVNAAAFVEHRRGAAMGASVSLLMAVGTGIGAGLMVDGRIYRGAHGVAPELGHLVVVPDGRPCPCGKRGCLERYCSGTALVRSAADRGLPLSTGIEVVRAARAGDARAVAAVEELADWLGLGLAMIADLFDPDRIVLGGGVSRAADLLLPRATAALRRSITGGAARVLPELAVARFGADASMIGAAALAADAVSRSERTPGEQAVAALPRHG